MLICFWVCFAIVGYVYAGYPLMLWMGVFGRRSGARREDLADAFEVAEEAEAPGRITARNVADG